VEDDASLKTHVKHHIKAGDLVKLTDFMTSSSWSYDDEFGDEDSPHPSSSTMTSMDDDNGMSMDGSMGHRDSIDSMASSASPRSS
jgi:hypothetical protein